MDLEKKALLIIPAYDKLPENQHLPGTAKDAEAMKKILLEKFAFEDNDIKVLQGEQAAKERINEALNNLAKEVRSGSIVFMYYSGHGVYLPNSQDEGLLPTVTSWPITTPLEEVCFTGRDFLPFLDNLSIKKAKCFLIFDCCHSGQLYRVAEFKESGLRPKQVILKEANSNTEKKSFTKADRGGWIPEEKDHFAYIAACNTVQVALEEIGKGGRLTMGIENVLNSLQDPGSVSYEAFFRLLKREFKHRGWDRYQAPQIEGSNLDTVLFGITKVISKPGGIVIKDVPNEDDVILDAGFLQNLSSGEYNVFDSCASEVSTSEGSKSKDWLGTIDVDEGVIDPAQAYGSIVERAENKEITCGCLAYLKKPHDHSIKNNVFIDLTEEDVDYQQVKELSKYLKATNMLNVSEKPTTDNPDLIIITIEQFKENSEKSFVARCRGNVIVPPIGIDQGEVMAGNVDRHLRYKMALEKAKKPIHKEDLLENVSLKVFKVEKVIPFTKYTKEQRIQEGLKGTDIFQASDQRPTFKSHSITEGTNKLIDQSGDAFIFQVSNNNTNQMDIVHICILFYQFNGEIRAIYPPRKKGQTIALRGGETAEGILRLYIPKDSLRIMAEPDPSKEEPNFGIDTLVLYATSSCVDLGPLEQTLIKTDPALVGRDRGDFNADPLSDLKSFQRVLKVNKRCGAPDDLKEDIQLFIKQVELEVHK